MSKEGLYRLTNWCGGEDGVTRGNCYYHYKEENKWWFRDDVRRIRDIELGVWEMVEEQDDVQDEQEGYLKPIKLRGFKEVIKSGDVDMRDSKETPRMSADDILFQAKECIDNRAKERDIDNERSMEAATKAFNAMYDIHLTEEMGWMFMVLLKMSRSRYGLCNKDHYVDGAAYFALAAEPSQRDR